MDLNFEDLGHDIYRYHAYWTNQFYKNNISIIEKNYKKYPNKNRWNCDCHVVHDDDNDYDLEKINFKFLRIWYSKIIDNFCDQKKYLNFRLSDIWYNYYKIGQYQEPHTHGNLHDKSLTVVHYILYDELHHEPTRFTNKKITLPKINEGDLLIFPSHYEHYVLKNNSETPRLTIAFTVTLW